MLIFIVGIPTYSLINILNNLISMGYFTFDDSVMNFDEEVVVSFDDCLPCKNVLI